MFGQAQSAAAIQSLHTASAGDLASQHGLSMPWNNLAFPGGIFANNRLPSISHCKKSPAGDKDVAKRAKFRFEDLPRNFEDGDLEETKCHGPSKQGSLVYLKRRPKKVY